VDAAMFCHLEGGNWLAVVQRRQQRVASKAASIESEKRSRKERSDPLLRPMKRGGNAGWRKSSGPMSGLEL
jgi:hypothetical protein